MPGSNEIADSDAESDSEDLRGSSSESQLEKATPSEPVENAAIQGTARSDLDVNFEDFLSQSQKYDTRVPQSSSPPKTTFRPSNHAPNGPAGGSADGWSARGLQSELQAAQSYLLDGSSTDMSAKLQSSDSPNAAKLKRRQTDLGRLGKGDASLEEHGGQRRRRARTETIENKETDRDGPQEPGVRKRQRGRGLEQPKRLVKGKRDSLDPPADAQWQASSTDRSAPNAFINPMDMHLDQPYMFDAFPEKSTEGTSPDSDEEDDVRPRKRAKSGNFKSLLNDSSLATTSQSTMGNYQTYNIDYRGQPSSIALTANPFADESSQGPDTAAIVNGEIRELHKVSHASTSKAGSPFHPQANSLSQTSQPPSSPEDHPRKKILATYSRRKSRVLSSDDGNSDIDELAGDADVLLPADEDRQDRGPTKPPKKRGRPPKEKQESISLAHGWSAAENASSDNDNDSLPKGGSKRQLTQSGPDIGDEEAELPKNRRYQKAADGPAPSPEKNPSSGLHLSDESVIGLPTENYKPRPSRSRSKRVEEDNNSITQPSADDVTERPTQQAKLDTGQMLPPPSKKGRKQAKAKVKRAKTSAPPKSSDMIEEGDRDVLWLDTRPATVKLDLPSAELSPVKKEKTENETTPAAEKKNQDDESSECNTAVAADLEPKSLVSVEIPAANPVVYQEESSEPKRRGRKKKAVPPADQLETKDDNQETPIPALEVVIAEIDPEPTNTKTDVRSSKRRHPLGEKSLNQRSELRSKTLVDEDSAQGNQQPTDTSASSPEKVPPTTPLKAPQTENENESPTEKGPTKHSPIKPSDSAVKFRVGLSKKQRIPPLLRIVRK